MSAVPGPRILLVEDEFLNRELAKAILARTADPALRTMQLVEAATLAAARSALAEWAIDVILLDIQLPDGNGLELAREVSARPAPHRPAIIALTASALIEQHAAAIDAGCDSVVTKPYTAAELEKVLAEYLDGRRPSHTEPGRR